MPPPKRVDVPAYTVTKLTGSSSPGTIAFQIKYGDLVNIMGTTGATPSASDFADGFDYVTREGERGTLDDIFPGGSYTDLYAFSRDDAVINVYHA